MFENIKMKLLKLLLRDASIIVFVKEHPLGKKIPNEVVKAHIFPSFCYGCVVNKNTSVRGFSVNHIMKK